MFGALPANAELAPVADANPPLGPDAKRSSRWTCRNRWRNSAIAASPARTTISSPAYVLNYIIGGGGFSSRLMEEVREKRGLAYSVHSNLFPFQHGAVFVGNVATKNEAVGQSLEVIESELRRARRAGPDRRGARQRQELSDRRLCAPIRILVEHRQPAAVDPDRGSRHRLRQSPQRADRGGEPRGHQARRQAPDRGRPPDHHHRRQAGGDEDRKAAPG